MSGGREVRAVGLVVKGSLTLESNRGMWNSEEIRGCGETAELRRLQGRSCFACNHDPSNHMLSADICPRRSGGIHDSVGAFGRISTLSVPLVYMIFEGSAATRNGSPVRRLMRISRLSSSPGTPVLHLR